MGILWDRQAIIEILENDKIDPKVKSKLQLILKVKKFAEKDLGLKKSKNYQSYVKLKNPFVSYVVNATPKYSMKAHTWNYPIVGSLTYKGFPEKEDALKEQAELKKQGLDTYVRGVSAYSTLGWFDDPVLSSMLNYSDEQLVELIIHESTHEFLYIKSNSNFNEQLASFFGRIGTELYYKKYDPKKISKLRKIDEDEKNFSAFIKKAKEKLEMDYKTIRESETSEKQKMGMKQKVLEGFRKDYKENLKPKLKILSYKSLLSKDLNNAQISLYGTYIENQSLFENLFKHLNSKPRAYLEFLKKWEHEEEPLKKLEGYLKKINSIN